MKIKYKIKGVKFQSRIVVRQRRNINDVMLDRKKRIKNTSITTTIIILFSISTTVNTSKQRTHYMSNTHKIVTFRRVEIDVNVIE